MDQKPLGDEKHPADAGWSIRRGADRGFANHGWLRSHHTFSFAGYYNPAAMGHSVLRVINDDRVAGGAGFPTHPHENMEILSYVLEGELEHRDSMGTGSKIRPGEIQLMSAGSGVTHSEFNASATELVHFLQIWIVPNKQGGEPGYQQSTIDEDSRRNRFAPLATPEGLEGETVLRIKQDARVLSAKLENDARLEHEHFPGRYGWLHVAKGVVGFGRHTLEAGDALAIFEDSLLSFEGREEAELLLFDLPHPQDAS